MSRDDLSRRETISTETVTDARDSKRSIRAQRRWRILARAVTGSPEPTDNESEEGVSVRRFTSFGLLKCTSLENVADGESSWCEYSAQLEDGQSHDVQIRRISKCFTASELIGFNNTGNVCVWPSEECLGYYLLRNRGLCRNRSVLELGGGMSCLAGMLVAKYCNPSAVTLTDGNVTSVDNVRCIVARNDMTHLVECGVVQWARSARALRQATANGNRVKVNVQTPVSRGPLHDPRLLSTESAVSKCNVRTGKRAGVSDGKNARRPVSVLDVGQIYD